MPGAAEGSEFPGARPRDVVLAQVQDRPAIEDSLADAFYDDPVMSWIVQDPSIRRRRLARLFGVLLRAHYLRMDTVWTTPDTVGAALWAPPGHAIIPAPVIMRNSVGMLRALGKNSLRALRALSYVEHRHPTEPHWYLGVLGTRTADQGKGVGSALLQPVLERCDAEGTPAFLESSKESNIAFYNRHGFEVTSEIKLPPDGPPVWPMWRDPKPR